MEIQDAIRNLKKNNSMDIYGLKIKIMKEIHENLAQPLTHLHKAGICEGIFQDKFKINRVVPIFKKGVKEDFNNYGSIPVITIFGEILETIFKPTVYRIVEGFEEQ